VTVQRDPVAGRAPLHQHSETGLATTAVGIDCEPPHRAGSMIVRVPDHRLERSRLDDPHSAQRTTRASIHELPRDRVLLADSGGVVDGLANHAVGMRPVSNFARASRIQAATVAEVLGDAGYARFAMGK